MKYFLIKDKENNKLTEVMSNSINDVSKNYEGKEIIEKPEDFIYRSDKLDYYTKDLKIKDVDTLIKEGLEATLSDDEEIKDGKRIKLDEIGFYKKNALKEKYTERFKFTILDKDENGNEYLRELTEKEKLEKLIITKEEYNEHINVKRKSMYMSETDPLIIEKIIDYLKLQNIDITEIENKKIKIKNDNKKI